MRSTTVAGGRQHHDRDRRVALAQVPREAQAVLAGHVDVDQRQVDRMLRGHRLRGAGVLGAQRRVAVRGEVLLAAPRARPARRRRPGSWPSGSRFRARVRSLSRRFLPASTVPRQAAQPRDEEAVDRYIAGRYAGENRPRPGSDEDKTVSRRHSSAASPRMKQTKQIDPEFPGPGNAFAARAGPRSETDATNRARAEVRMPH